MSKIECYRKNLDLTQDELAKKAKVSRKALVNYENGKGNPTQSTLRKIAKALNCAVSDLIE